MTTRISGLSLGQGPQSTSLVYMEASKGPDGPSFCVSSLRRWIPGTSLATIIKDLRNNFDSVLAGSSLVIDRTEIGEPVLRILEAAQFHDSNVRFYVIAHQTDNEKDTVARTDLGDTIRLVRDTGRMEFAKDLDSRELVMSACRSWQMKALATGPDSLWRREADEDDIMCALSLPMWYVERYSLCDASPYPIPTKTIGEQIAERCQRERRIYPPYLRGGFRYPG
jgi:hypothetical protein